MILSNREAVPGRLALSRMLNFSIKRRSLQDWRRIFNLGIGMILVVSKSDLPAAGKILQANGYVLEE